MSLPLYQNAEENFHLMQTGWAQQLDPVISLPINSGITLKKILLTSGMNQVSHLLARKLQGWFIVRQRSSASVYDLQDANQTPALTLSLMSSANVSVDLFVF